MADVVLNPGVGGNTVSTDTIGGKEFQRIKVVDGPDGGTTRLRIPAEDDAHVSTDGGIQLLAVRKDVPANLSGTDGDYEPLQVSGGFLWVRPSVIAKTVKVDVTRPADTTAYTASDAISNSTSAPTAGGFTIANAARISGGSCQLVDVMIATAADAATRLAGEIYLFDQAVTNINDNAAFAVSDTEIKTCVGVIPFSLFDAGNNGLAQVVVPPMICTCVGSADLRFLLRARNAYTPVSAEVLSFAFKLLWLD